MDRERARALIAPTIRHTDRSWADVGAGNGTFTRVLAELLGTSATVYAVDRDASALSALHALAAEADERTSARIVVLQGDFTTLALPRVDGVLAANALHFVAPADQAQVLGHFARALNAGGRVVLIEYDRERGNPWVPYPIARRRLARLAREAGFASAAVVASTASEFGGEMYVAELAAGGDQLAGHEA